MALHAARAIRQQQRQQRLDQPLPQASFDCEEERKALEEAFEAADKNGDGVLSVDEYQEIFSSHGLTVDRIWIERTIARNDRDGDGGISLQEFLEMNLEKKNKKPQPSHSSSGLQSLKESSTSLYEKAKLAFNLYDRNRDGFLTKAEFRRTSKKMTQAQVDAVFDKFDKNRDGRLDFEEFKELMESNKNKGGEARAKNEETKE